MLMTEPSENSSVTYFSNHWKAIGKVGLKPIHSEIFSNLSSGKVFWLTFFMKSIGFFEAGAFKPPNSTVPAHLRPVVIGVTANFPSVTIIGLRGSIDGFS